jgi:hypothetical protein
VHRQHPHERNKREKKKKRNKQKETPISDRKPNNGKKQDHLKKTSLGPLRQGQRLETSETKNKAQAKSANHRTKAQTPQRAPPAHMQAPPEQMHANQLKTWQLQQLQLTPVRPVIATGQTGA